MNTFTIDTIPGQPGNIVSASIRLADGDKSILPASSSMFADNAALAGPAGALWNASREDTGWFAKLHAMDTPLRQAQDRYGNERVDRTLAFGEQLRRAAGSIVAKADEIERGWMPTPPDGLRAALLSSRLIGIKSAEIIKHMFRSPEIAALVFEDPALFGLDAATIPALKDHVRREALIQNYVRGAKLAPSPNDPFGASRDRLRAHAERLADVELKNLAAMRSEAEIGVSYLAANLRHASALSGQPVSTLFDRMTGTA